VGDGSGVPREAGDWVRLTFKAMVSLNQKRKKKEEVSTKGRGSDRASNLSNKGKLWLKEVIYLLEFFCNKREFW